MTPFSILLFLFVNLRKGSLCIVGFTMSKCLNCRVSLNLFSSVLRGVHNLKVDYGEIFFEKNGGYRGLLLCFSGQVTSFCRRGTVPSVKGGFRPKVTAAFND